MSKEKLFLPPRPKIKCLKTNRLLTLAFFLATFFTSFCAYATPVVVLDENYDRLTPGDPLPGWVAVEPSRDPTLPYVQQTDFNSPPNDAAVRNDFGVARLFNPIEGIVTLEIWMKPKLGSDTNNGISFVTEGVGIGGLVWKNETDWWRYIRNGVQTPFAPVSATGHNLKIIYYTSTTRYDLYPDGNLVVSNNPWDGVPPGTRLVGVWTASGRGTTSYFDNPAGYCVV